EPFDALLHGRNPTPPVLDGVTDDLSGLGAVEYFGDDCRITVGLELEAPAVSLRCTDRQPGVSRGHRVTRRRLPDDLLVLLEGGDPVEHQVVTELWQVHRHRERVTHS